jgi:hypothetical protein
VVFRLVSLWMRLHVPEERARRPRQKEHAGRMGIASDQKAEQHRTAVRARRPGVLGRAAAGASRRAAGRWQSTQQACQCKKAANATYWVCAAAARQVKEDLWAGATIDMTNRGWIAASRRGRSCP